MLHRFAKLLAACTVLLILAGSLVTSHDAGLSVPDWPTSYGWNMFTFPPSMWVANIFYEHGHRLVASGVGFLTIILTVWLLVAEPRRWMRWLGVAALGTVVAQGLLGGLTVKYFLPPAVSTAHAALAEIFFCMTVAIALFTSPGWHRPHAAADAIDDAHVRRLAVATTAIVFCQILVGATMRHTGAGLAIPDFPLMFGHLIPDHWDSGIVVHFTHRVGALAVAAMAIWTSVTIWRRHSDHVDLAQPSLLILIFIVIQATLGALTILSRRQPWINSLHVVGGALVLTTSLVITLRAWRFRLGITDGGSRIGNPQSPPNANPQSIRNRPSAIRNGVRA
jgi:heme a synthase